MLPVPGILMLCNYLQNVVAITYIFVLQLSTFLFYNKQADNCADGICTICNKKEEPVQAPQMYVISKSCSYVPVRADYIRVLPGVRPSAQPD